MKQFLIYIILVLLFIACDDDPVATVDPPKGQNGLLVVNEGLFGQNNASLSLFSYDEETISDLVYASENHGNRIGDTANDIEIFDGKAYIAVTQSNKIEIVNLEDYKSEGFIDLGMDGSPRELVVISETEGYVTSLNKSEVIRFNPATKEVTGSIKVGQQPEGIAEANGYLFVANSGFGADSTVSVIHRGSFILDKNIVVRPNPRFALKDNMGNVYIVSTGIYDGAGNGGVYKISSTSLTVTDSVFIDQNPGECTLDGDYIYLANTPGIHKISMSALSDYQSNNIIVTSSDVNPTNSLIYSVYYDSHRNSLFAGNPKDFTQNGEVVEYDLEGNELMRFNCGLNPGTIISINIF